MSTTVHIPSPLHTTNVQLENLLYSPHLPINENYLSVSDLHEVWFAEYGNKNGIPVLFVHGGPGGGTSDNDARFFDPSVFRIIRFDQRGCGRSRPHAEIKENTTQDLIADMEKIREHLGISSWILFGGSWGSCLSLAYGQAHPDKVKGFVLRGIFLGTKMEYMKLWHEMGDFYPEVFKEYRDFIPEHERHNLCEAYHRRLMNPDPLIHLPAAKAFYKYDVICATLIDKKDLVELDDMERVVALSKLFAHYCVNNFFFEPDQLMNNLHHIHHRPAYIVHGRYDMICRPSTAFKLYENWPGSHLWMVPDAGHSLYEVGIAKATMEACKKIGTFSA